MQEIEYTATGNARNRFTGNMQHNHMQFHPWIEIQNAKNQRRIEMERE
jgi:hypothetical protein